MAIFIEDFERTESSDEIFGVIGRALVIATRFDSMCKTLAGAIDLKFPALFREVSDNDFNSLVEKALKKSSTLDKSIKNLGLPDDLSAILHDARKARNSIAHDFALGMEGCIDTKVDKQKFLRDASDYMFDLAHGDVLISILIQMFNYDEQIRSELISTYKDKIVSWVIEN